MHYHSIIGYCLNVDFRRGLMIGTYLKLCNGIFLLLCQMRYSGEIAATTFTA
jgi:hypothetical protein